MKKIFRIAIALMVIFALAVPVFAADDGFVSSATANPAPGVQEGEPALEVKDSKGNVIFTTEVENLIITAIADLADKENLAISAEAAELLQKVYDELTAEDADLAELMPALAELCEELGIDINTVTITDLFDLTVNDQEFMDYLAEDEHTMKLTLEANVAPDYHVFVLVYVDDEWKLIESVVNNNDGTIDCVFEEICPVAILTAPPAVEEETEPATEPATEAPATEAPAPEATDAPADAENVEEEKNGGSVAVFGGLAAVIIGILYFLLKRKGAKV